MNSVARVVSCVVVWLVACGEPPDTTNYSECERHEHCPRGGQVCCDNVCIDGTACDEAPVDFVADAARTCDVGLTGVDCNFLLPTHCESLFASMGGRVPLIEARHLSVFPDGTVRVMIDGDLGLERSNEDSIWLTLTTSHNGRFDLSDPANWSFLGQEIHSVDVYADGGNFGGHYHSVAGAFSVTGSVYPNAGPFSIELSPSFLVQITQDDYNHMYAVDGGRCFWDQSLRFDYQCSSECDGRVCGTDGCGGDCGACTGDKRCSLRGDACAAEGVCQAIELTGPLTNHGWFGAPPSATGARFELDVTYAGLGSAQGQDVVTLELRTYAQGPIDLATPDNRAWWGEHHVFLTVDGYRELLARSGTLVIDSSSDPNASTLRATLTNLVFEEVLPDEAGEPAPIPPSLGGQCVNANVPGLLSTP